MNELHKEQANEEGEEVEDDIPTQSIFVRGEHPATDFHPEDLVVVLASDKNPFWVARVMSVDNETLMLGFFHHNTTSGGKQIWKVHNSTGSCHYLDVLVRFKDSQHLFTKTQTIRGKALKKINQALLLYRTAK